ncbi:MAG: glycosyltransferase family 4 protein [Nitrospirae bacterium]|nr:glycosyltransferase family 4 protein [Nitrospirota bacterium]
MNEVLIRALRENQIEVVECNQSLWKKRMEKVEKAKGIFSIISLIPRLSRAYISLSWKFFRIGSYDAIIVGYPGHFDFFLVKFLNIFRRNKPVLINLLFSLYDTIVLDRQLIPPGSFMAKCILIVDRTLLRWADRIILDTSTHIEHICKMFNIDNHKFIRVPVGADDTLFKPINSAPKVTTSHGISILFFGTYIPLHGIEYILQAANRLKSYTDIRFTLIGSGQTYEAMLNMAKALNLTNVTFINSWVPYQGLVQYIQIADICLGIFGTTEKASMVIPCKIYNCLAMGKPVITADTPAAREILSDGVHAILCPPGDPQSLASAILKLRDSPRYREDIGKAGYDLFRTTMSPGQVGFNLRQILEEIV